MQLVEVWFDEDGREEPERETESFSFIVHATAHTFPPGDALRDFTVKPRTCCNAGEDSG
jgi:hypothetical protein